MFHARASKLSSRRSESRGNDALVTRRPRLSLGSVADKAERDAEHLVGKVVPASTAPMLGAPAKNRQTVSSERANAPTTGPESRLPFGSGQPLPPEDRDYFESRFAHHFGSVRVHHNAAAGLAARSIGARAFVLDHEIVVDEAHPERKFLAHELAHVALGHSGIIRRSDLKKDVQWRGLNADELRKLNNAELKQLLLFVESLMGEHTSNADDEALAANYAQIQSVALERWHSPQPAPDQPQTPGGQAEAPHARAGTPGVTAKNELVQAMAVFNSIRPSNEASGLYTGTVNGRAVSLTATQYAELRTAVIRSAGIAIDRAQSRLETASGRYDEQQKVDAQHWLVAPIVKTFGRVSDPGPEMLRFVKTGGIRLTQARAALAAGDFNLVARLAGEGETAAEQAALMVAAYVDQIIGAAEMTVTVLEGIKTASEVILFLCAIAATGGALGAAAEAIGLEGAGGASTLFGVTSSTATMAGVVTTTAAITEEVASGIARAADNEKVDWGAIATRAALQIILAKFSPRIGQGLSKWLGSRAVADKALRELIARVGMQRLINTATAVVMHEGSQIFSTLVEDTVAALRGKNVTWESFGDNLWERVSDPKGLFMAAIAGALAGVHPEPERGKSTTSLPQGPNTPSKSPTDNRSFADVNRELGLSKGGFNFPPGQKPPGSSESNQQWASVNRAVGLKKTRTPSAPPTPPAGHQPTTAQQEFLPTPEERAKAFAKEAGKGPPPPRDAAEAFRHTPEAQKAAFAADKVDPTQLGAGVGEIRESRNPSPLGNQFVAGAAEKRAALKTTIRASVGESEAYKEALRQGEYGLERPQKVNAGERDDFITARRDASGRMWIVATDAKTSSAARPSERQPFPNPESGLREGWDTAIKAAVDRASFNDPALEAEIKQAYREGRIWVRQVNVDYRAQSGGSISGVASPNVSPWRALLPRVVKVRGKQNDEDAKE